MMIRIQMFARARDLAGAEWIEVDLPITSTVRDLRAELVRKLPALEPLLKCSAIALEEEFAEDSSKLYANSNVAAFAACQRWIVC